MKITVLGSGTSTGVPQVGCTCPVCTSTDPHDKRLRCSGLIETQGVRILIDCGPDFREQSLRLPDFQPIDGVLITHEHYDHVGGLDDLRPFCHFRDVPVYAEQYTADRLKTRIPYCFAEHPYPGVPRIPLAEVEPYVPFKVTGGAGQEVEVVPLRVIHGRLPILGFRIGKMAWITDMTEMPAETYACLEGLDCLFMNALRLTPHPTHQSLSQALEQVERIRPRKAYFIHASHQLGMHAEVEATLPPHVRLAYDGLTVEIG
ncbi:beta-lactamase domain protein [Phocaeicola salanitronis DSM 18170]|uniref:Beta-lactamase domain protein n=1 Tax=Phocaeicola salanitronis (strain DSM 18170 / JCM 13657 / CCUG 60908 / BL78) TaxID=667015 RepID=F0R402_PHOSB|nr:MBL fold metallo-hydrolase [Phocaeicola salanitronis]ADY35577.1 beta-lactamase domain protein [Phocaeicola salanitronis DSM 18170]